MHFIILCVHVQVSVSLKLASLDLCLEEPSSSQPVLLSLVFVELHLLRHIPLARMAKLHLLLIFESA